MPRIARRVLLIGWDAADWTLATPLLEAGKMPNLQGLIERGAMGSLASLSPILSPILWTTVATGRYADEHGVLSFVEPDAEAGTVRPVRSTSRRCAALWNILSRHGLQVGVVHWLASHPAEQVNGFVVSERFTAEALRDPSTNPAELGAVWPPDLAEDLAPALVRPGDVTPLQMGAFVNIADAATRKDPRTGELRRLLARTASTQALATLLMQTEPWDFMAVYFEGIDRFGHSFMPYHPPRQPHVPEEEFERYRGVMAACYRFHDMMLGRMLELAGDDTLVLLVSDHGFRSDHRRPEASPAIGDGQATSWHTPQGILVAAGAGVLPDHLVFGASLLDLAPTILASLGVPISREMPGRVLYQMWPAGALTWETTDTLEAGPPVSVPEGSEPPGDPWGDAQVLKRLMELGYLEDVKLERALMQSEWTLATVYAGSQRPAKALRHLEAVLQAHPDELAAYLMMARCKLAMGDLEGAQEAAEQVLARRPGGPRGHLLAARALLLAGREEEALENLRAVEEADPESVSVQQTLGAVQLRRRDWKAAEVAFRRALAIEPLAPSAWTGLGSALRRQGRCREAAEALMRSVGMLHHQLEAHLELALAVLADGQVEWAIRALETAMALGPDDPRPHEILARVYSEARPDTRRAVYHEARARQLQPPAQS